jgi:uncharacterized protein (DUF302 family)
MGEVQGLITQTSEHDVDETVRRFRAAAEAAGLRIFADIDHGRGAADAGMALRPTRLLVFGHPRGGTPLMQLGQTIGIDLPLRILVWEDENGTTRIAHPDPRALAERHGLGAAARPATDAIAQGMTRLLAAATRAGPA